MAKAGYSAVTGGAVALTAASVKSVFGIKANAAFGIDLTKVRFGFNGITTVEPVLVELCYATFATNSPGVSSTSVTPAQAYGRVLAHGVTAAKNWTVEPTVLTVLEEEYLTPNAGQLWYDFPLGTTPDSAFDTGFVVRATTASGVSPSMRVTMSWERC